MMYKAHGMASNPPHESAVMTASDRGAPRGVTRGASLPLRPKNTIFSGFLPLNYTIGIFAACVLKLFAMWKNRRSLQHGSGLA